MGKKKNREKLKFNLLLIICFLMVNLNSNCQDYDNYRIYFRPSKNDNIDSVPFVQAAFENNFFSYEHIMDSVEYTSFKLSQDTLYLPYFPYSNKYLNKNEFGYYVILEPSGQNENIIFLVYTYENGSKRKLKYRVIK